MFALSKTETDLKNTLYVITKPVFLHTSLHSMKPVSVYQAMFLMHLFTPDQITGQKNANTVYKTQTNKINKLHRVHRSTKKTFSLHWL